ncbi:MAG: hypothetical protein OIN84_11910 [Candidatus Methanoperedens sp.]|uniref:hypothetical protein n=1 Tax=Candidatus Methanoperedens sp. BLZ2 TaxID=2035255 RepID=UPI000BE3842F|nr:hypothetical protein [Candidatus Methanoperedens sp. BLZ2]KAB2947517.1 MAG: hypothetical protein F9K14_03675 [Candidatus Methanoperedens sp.]MBZ0175102.1 hypothetical protein [Candidatus Methanoperedens nitroreducens]MCX9078667.1 hypothetical protein [Candidatus Methanoperedens sp.]
MDFIKSDPRIFAEQKTWGSTVQQERISSTLPEGKVRLALNLFKASAAPEDSKEEKNIKGEIKI